MICPLINVKENLQTNMLLLGPDFEMYFEEMLKNHF